MLKRALNLCNNGFMNDGMRLLEIAIEELAHHKHSSEEGLSELLKNARWCLNILNEDSFMMSARYRLMIMCLSIIDS